MRHIFLCAISDLELTENLGRGDKIIDDLFVTNDPEMIEIVLSNWDIENIGELLAHEFRSASSIIYSQCEILIDGPSASAVDYHEARTLTDVDLFLSMLWLIKDNSCSIDLILARRGRDNIAFPRMRSQARFTASGDISQTRFSREELRKARELFRLFAKDGRKYNEGPTSLRKNTTNSVSRALSHRHTANQARDVGVKIASYFAALEALFVPGKNEISHQLAERVAFFLEHDPAERRKIFEKIKDAYGFRSLSVHGLGIKGSEQGIIETAITCDDVLRRVLVKIMENEDFHPIFIDQKKLDEFFLNEIVGPKLS